MSDLRKPKKEIHSQDSKSISKRSQRLIDLERDIVKKQILQRDSTMESFKKKESDKKLQLAIARGEEQFKLVCLRKLRLSFLNWRLCSLETLQIFEKLRRLSDWKKYQSVWSHWKTAIKWKKYKREAEIASFRRKKELILEQKASNYFQTTLLSKVLLAWHLFTENKSTARAD
jgi:hypothetical protein